MRKIVLGLSISRDGFFEGRDGAIDWIDDKENGLGHLQSLLSHDTIFYGRKAYEKVGIAHRHTGIYSAPFERHVKLVFDGVRKYVFSRTRRHVPGTGMVISEGLEAEVRRICDEDGKSIWLCGGAEITETFAALDLIDEYMIAVHPVTLRSGRRLFDGGWPSHLSLVKEHTMTSGIVVQYYLPESRRKVSIHDRNFQDQH